MKAEICQGCGQQVTPTQYHPIECCVSFKAGQEDRCFENCTDTMLSFKKSGRKEVVGWIEGNAIFSHEPSYENIMIKAEEIKLLKQGEIPKDRPQILYGTGWGLK